jgi:hypothetical protein
MTQDVYLGRRAGNASNLVALEAVNPALVPSQSTVTRGDEAACVPAFVPRAPACGAATRFSRSGRGPPGDRTLNPRIKSPLLCRLS